MGRIYRVIYHVWRPFTLNGHGFDAEDFLLLTPILAALALHSHALHDDLFRHHHLALGLFPGL